MKKTSRDIHPSNIPTNFENNPNIGCRVRVVDRRRYKAIGPVDIKMCICGYSGGGGGPGWPINNLTGPILLPSYPLTYINLHIKYGSNLIMIFLSYHVNDEMSADKDAA